MIANQLKDIGVNPEYLRGKLSEIASLRAINAELVAALELAIHAAGVCSGWGGDERGQSTRDALDLMRAALAKVRP